MNKNGGAKSSGGNSAQEYLLGKGDEPRENARLLKGDPDATTEVINGLNFAKIYTSGTLAFAYNEGEKLSEQDKFDIIEKFENALFPNIPIEQISGYWVEHTDKILRDEKTDEPILDANGREQKRLELNFIYANVELTTGKALPVYYHDNDVHLTSAFRDVINAEYDLIDPNAINHRQSLSIPKNLPRQKREILESAHDLVSAELSLGNINDRNDILKVLKDAGIAIASKPTHKYISLQDPEGGQNIRMKGEIYDKSFTVEKFIREHNSSAATQLRYSDADIAAARERLQYSVGKRAERFESRFRANESGAYPVLHPKQSRDIDELNRDDEILIEVEHEYDDDIAKPERKSIRADTTLSSLSFDAAIEGGRAYKDTGTEIQANNSRSIGSSIREQQSAFEASQSLDQSSHADIKRIDIGVDSLFGADIRFNRSFRAVEKNVRYFSDDSCFSGYRSFELGVVQQQQRGLVHANRRTDDKRSSSEYRAGITASTAPTNAKNDARFSRDEISFTDITDSINQFVGTTRRTVADVQHDIRRDRAYGQDREATIRDNQRTKTSSPNSRNYHYDIVAIEEGVSQFHRINEKIRLAIEKQEQARQEQQREFKEQQSVVNIKPVSEINLEPSTPIAPKPRDDSFDFGM